MQKLHIRLTKADFTEMSGAHLLVVFDAHAKCIDEYRKKNGFLTTGTVNEAPHSGPTSH